MPSLLLSVWFLRLRRVFNIRGIHVHAKKIHVAQVFRIVVIESRRVPYVVHIDDRRPLVPAVEEWVAEC